MSDVISGDRRSLLKSVSISHTDEFVYTLPILPKIGVAINVNAAIALFIPIVLITLINRHDNVHSIVILSKLIFCFWIGAATAVFSGLCDYVARKMYNIEKTREGFFWKCADLFDYSAVGMSLASMTIFCWGAWYAFSALKDVALNF